jgi:hypothetical protein
MNNDILKLFTSLSKTMTLAESFQKGIPRNIALEVASSNPAHEIIQKLQKAADPFSSNPAYQAMKRLQKVANPFYDSEYSRIIRSIQGNAHSEALGAISRTMEGIKMSMLSHNSFVPFTNSLFNKFDSFNILARQQFIIPQFHLYSSQLEMAVAIDIEKAIEEGKPEVAQVITEIFDEAENILIHVGDNGKEYFKRLVVFLRTARNSKGVKNTVNSLIILVDVLSLAFNVYQLKSGVQSQEAVTKVITALPYREFPSKDVDANTAIVLRNAILLKSPNIKGKKIRVLAEGSKVYILKENKKWIEVAIQGKENILIRGFLPKEYLLIEK